MNWEIIILGNRKPLSDVELSDIPDDIACVLSKGNNTSFRVIKVPSVKRLVVWDTDDKKRTTSFLLRGEQPFAEMVTSAIEFWEDSSDSRHSMVD